jgi:hypothetical protein
MAGKPSQNVVAALRALAAADKPLLNYEIGARITSDPGYTGRGTGQRGARYVSNGILANAPIQALRKRGWVQVGIQTDPFFDRTDMTFRITDAGRAALAEIDTQTQEG